MKPAPIFRPMPPARYPGPSTPAAGPQNISAQQYDEYIRALTEFWAASSGFERRKLEEQIREAQLARQNAMELAKLQAETSRYGVNMQRQTAIEQLKEEARQFDASHGVELQKLGLDRAKTATEYLSTPDRYFQAGDFMDMSARALGGQGGPRPYGATGPVRAKTEADFAVLSGYGGSQATGMQTNVGGGGTPRGGGSAVADAPNGGGAATDPRTQVIANMVKAVPPSTGPGMDNNDFAVLQAAQALYSTNLRPGTYEKMRPGQQAMMESAGRRLGIHTPDWKANYERGRVGQGGVRSV